MQSPEVLHLKHKWIATASNGGSAANVLIDDDSIWTSSDAEREEWIQVDMMGTFKLSEFSYKPNGNGSNPETPKDCQLEAWDEDRMVWKVLSEWSADLEASVRHISIKFPMFQSRLWKFRIKNTYGNGHQGASIKHLCFFGNTCPEKHNFREAASGRHWQPALYGETVPLNDRISDYMHLQKISHAAEQAAYQGVPGTYTFYVFENERWVLTQGFKEHQSSILQSQPKTHNPNPSTPKAKHLLPTERANLSAGDGIGDYLWTSLGNDGEPVVACPAGWSWASPWDVEVGKNTDREGWRYAAIWGTDFGPKPGVTSTVRRRKWSRVMAMPSGTPLPTAKRVAAAGRELPKGSQSLAQHPPFVIVRAGGEICGIHLQGSGKAEWKGIEDAVSIAQSLGHVMGESCRYVQNANGKAYFYAGGSENGHAGPNNWRLDPVERKPMSERSERVPETRRAVDALRGRLAQNAKKLNERGEKISRIQDDSEALASESAKFADAARKVRQEQEAQAAKGLFGGLF